MPVMQRPWGDLYYEDSEGPGPEIVFSHGFLMTHDMFEPQIAALREEFRCISWDQRGHGDSMAPGAFTLWDSAEDLVALLDHLGVERPFHAGMSQGGFITMRVALKAPNRVRGIVFIDSQAGPELEELRPLHDAQTEEWLQRGPARDLAEATAEVILGPAERETWIEKWLEQPREAIVPIYDALMGRDDLRDRLDEIVCPTIVIHGEADVAIPMERAEQLAEGLPHCVGLVRVPGAGHAANLSHPGIVTETIRDFCRLHGS
jgi:3-oxoadipate enol-lactonase